MKNMHNNATREGSGALMVVAFGLCAVIPNLVFAQGAKGAKSAGTLDLVAQHKDEYSEPEKPVFIEIGEARYLALAGKGAPEGAEFQEKVGAMYGVAYGLKMKSKFSGRDFVVAPLEGLWWGAHDETSFVATPRETWQWKLLIRVPAFITKKDVLAAASGAKGGAGKEVQLEVLTEGRCVQVLHTGPYSDEPKTIAAMGSFAKENGMVPNGKHHEIYLTDPNRTAPEKMKTILRQPVKGK